MLFMRTYLISYDLGVPETSEDYKSLIAHIKGFSLWAHLLYSVWLVKSGKTAAQIRDEITSKIDANDKLLVIDVTGADWATRGVVADVTDWMKKNI